DCDVTSEVKEAATCSKKGTTTYTATYKGLSDTKDVVDIEIVPSAHIFGDSYTVDEPATCAKEGSESIHCSECGAIKEGSSRVIEKTTNHNYGDWNIIKDATCTEDGSKEKICSVCNDKITEVIPATNHDWNAPTYKWTADYKSVTATRVCKNDPAHVESETVNTTSKVTKKPTYTAKGQTTYTATFSNAAFSTQTKTVTSIAQLPKKANTITVKVKKPTVKYAKLKKKAQTILAKNAFVVSKAQGKVTYKRISGNKKITINSAGKITLKKGLKKGTYKVRVKVTAAGTTAYKAGAKTVTLSIKVK
ncbi:MAG: hypothetical protein Q4B54_11130, partial [Coriobacteriales bacterium]|nr:hypothetical protein [Coriobacteriales bacterium]